MSTLENLYSIPSYAAPSRPRPRVVIVEQPSRSLRFRYSCEQRPGRIAGASSTPENKTPFAIQVLGYQGRVQVVVSCVTKDPPHRPHPHNLVGQNCKKGVCSFETEVTPQNPIITFPKVAVQCVKKNDFWHQLTVREEKNIDPFLTGFKHKDDARSIDLNVVRLCFQVFLKCGSTNRTEPLTPIASDPIYNRKNPVIYRMSHCNSPATGRDDDIILLCNKITKEDIKIRFFQMEFGQIAWEDFGSFNPNHVYSNTAICFRPPKYRNQKITQPVKVLVQLVRPSDDVASPTVDFEYLPSETEKRKKCDINSPRFEQLLQELSGEIRYKKQFKFDMPAIEASNNFLMETTSWTFPNPQLIQTDIPTIINNINQNEASSSRKSSQDEISNWNIPSDDFSNGTSINVENANEIRQVLNLDYIALEPIHISSGDLEMTNMERLSGTLQENLVM